MKKLVVLILVLLLVIPAAFAGNLPIGGGLKATPAPDVTAFPEAPQAPESTEAPSATCAPESTWAPEMENILTDPMARYEDLTDPEDPASIWFLRMIDSVNDEVSLAPDGMAVKREEYAVDADGTMTLKSIWYLYDTAYGWVYEVVEEVDNTDVTYFIFPEALVVFYNGMAMPTESGYEVEADLPKPNRFLNTYDAAETLLAMRAEKDGYAYLTDGGDGAFYEYLTDAALRYYQIRVYKNDADGVTRLARYIKIEFVEAAELPKAVTDAMRAAE